MKSNITAQGSEVYRGTSFVVTRESIALPSGRAIDKDVVRHPGAVVLIPQLSRDKLVMIRQYRHAIQQELLEFPAGTLEVGELPIECARRELIEEAGYAAAELIPLGTGYPAPGFCDEIHYYFLARNLHPQSGQPDDDEIISVCEMTLQEVEHAIQTEALIDTKSIAAFAKARTKGFFA